jgi:IMP cyclohydrolase
MAMRASRGRYAVLVTHGSRRGIVKNQFETKANAREGVNRLLRAHERGEKTSFKNPRIVKITTKEDIARLNRRYHK